jgi:hypothetical protein
MTIAVIETAAPPTNAAELAHFSLVARKIALRICGPAIITKRQRDDLRRVMADRLPRGAICFSVEVPRRYALGCRAGRHLTGTASPATLMPTYSRVRAGTSANVAESQSQHRRSVAVADPQPTRSHERAIKSSPRVPRAERRVRVRPESAGGVVSGALAGGDSGSPIGGELLPQDRADGAEQSAPDEHAEDREEPQRGWRPSR